MSNSLKNKNLDKLVNLLKIALRSNSKAKSLDANGNVTYVDSDIFSQEVLEGFINLSISDFNQIPDFTAFTLNDDKFIELFSAILVEGSVLYALSSQALIERGREFMMENNGVYFEPPSVSELLNTQYCTLLEHHWVKLKEIKLNIKNFQAS